jgi:hypothetical protein
MKQLFSPAMMHAGGQHGFMKNSLLLWQASSSTGDYHNQMNFENYKKINGYWKH